MMNSYLDNASVHLEEIVTRHSGLAGHPRWNDDKVAACQSLAKLLISRKPLEKAWFFRKTTLAYGQCVGSL
jgi:hypothetical protein